MNKEPSSEMEEARVAQPRYAARVAWSSEQRRRQLSSALGAARVNAEQLMILDDYLHISLTRRENSLPLFKLQVHMLEDLVIAEKGIAALKHKKDELEEKLGTTPSENERLENERRWIERELNFRQAEARAIRDIADGIAWRLFDYDRVALFELANKPSSKHINLEGLLAELQEFAQVFEAGEGIAVLNDLTNFLKLGDITVRKDSGTFEIVEVKGGRGRDSRITRQKQALRETISFLNTGMRDEEGEQKIISQIDVKPEAFKANIRSIVARAQKEGVIAERLGDHLIIICIDFLKAAHMEEDDILATVHKAYHWSEDWEDNGDRVVPFWSQDKYVFVRNYAPFSIFPLPESARVKLSTGVLWLEAHLNVSAVLRYLDQRGWTLVRTTDESVQGILERGDIGQTGFVRVRKAPLTVEIPWALFGRLGYEFLKPRTVVNVLDALLASGPTDAHISAINLSGEAEIWD